MVQLARTATATEAATTAVGELKVKLATYNAVVEISRASAALKETDRHLKSGGWSDAMDSYTEARQAMNRLAELPSALEGVKRDQLRSAVSRMAEFCKKLDSAIVSGKPPGGVARAIHQNRDHGDFLARISIHIEQAVT